MTDSVDDQNLPCPDLGHDQRVELTRAVFRVLRGWEVPEGSIGPLLGLPTGLKKRHLNRYRLGSPLPDDPQIFARALLLLKIDAALKQLFPHSELAANLWVTTPRAKSGNELPLDIMLRQGIEGMRRIESGLHNLERW